MIIWEGKSAARAIDVFLALSAANIDGVQMKKVETAGSPDFRVLADTDGDEQMNKSAFDIARAAGSGIIGDAPPARLKVVASTRGRKKR